MLYEESTNITEFLRETLKKDKVKLIKEFANSPDDFNFKFEPTTAELPHEIQYQCPILCAAVYYNAIQSFELLAEGGAKLTGTDSWLCGPIHMAARMGRLNVLESRFLETTNFAAPDWRGRTPAFFACENDHLDCLQFLIETKGCDVNAKDKFGMTCLHVAFEQGHVNIIEYLLSKGATVVSDMLGRTPVDVATEKGQIEVLRFYASRDLSALCQVDERGKNLMHWAAESGHTEIIQFLGSCEGIDVNKTDAMGLAPLHYAAERNHDEAIRALLGVQGCNRNIADSKGTTPLHLAAEFGCVKAIVALTQGVTGANSVKDVNGRTPLMVAAANGHLYAVQEIMKSGGVDVHEVDKTGGSARELVRGSYGPNILLALDGKEQKLGLLCNPRTGMVAAKPAAEPAPKKQESGCNVA